jgi:gamma-glutamylputrescine oxidase
LRQNAVFARTWYEDTAIAPPDFGQVALDDCAWDVGIIGGGLAGLTALLKLSQAGARVVLLEARSIAAGASGRNGGFCTGGWAADDAQILRLLGGKGAAAMEEIAEGGLLWMKERMHRTGWESTAATPGVLRVSLSGHGAPGDLDAQALAAFVKAPRYRHGAVSYEGVHFHPLNFMRLLAREALEAGGQIIEQAHVRGAFRTSRGWHIETSRGVCRAQQVIWAGGGYGEGDAPMLTSRILPIRTYIGVTEPLGEMVLRHIPTECAIGDTRRAGNYYRRLPDGRLLWGMGITAFGTLSIPKVKAMVLRDIAAILPGLADEMRSAGRGIDYGWAGNMAYAPHFLPLVGEIRPGFHALTGFGGHGMNTAPAAALSLVSQMQGNLGDPTPFSQIPRPPVFGILGRIAAEGSYRWRILQDFRAEKVSQSHQGQ